MSIFPYYQAVKSQPHTWLDYVSDDYAARVEQWCYARDHYTGDCMSPWRVPSYLIRKKIGETVEAYEERVLLADYTPYFGAVVDTLAGMMAQVEPDNSRSFGALGDKNEKDSVAGRLWVDADGAGSSWTTIWHLLSTDLVGVHDAWVLVDGGVGGLTPHVKLLPAESVTNWRHDANGVLIEGLLKERVDTRASIRDDPDEKTEDQWVEYTTAGWTRWHVLRNKDTREETPEKLGEGTYAYVTRAGASTIPLFPVQLPLRRNVGYMMARKANSIFNKESERDHLLRFGAFPIFNVFANDATFKSIVEKMRQGSRVLQVPPGGTAHSYASPSQEAAGILNATIQLKEQAYYATAFREFGASATRPGKAGRDRVTATEIKQDIATGVAAFLGLLRSAVDNAENQALYLLEQTAVLDKSRWGEAAVERTNDFAPFDVNEVIGRMKDRYIGADFVVPVGRKALIAIVKEIAEWDGVEINEDEIGKAVDVLIKMQQAAGMPPAPGGKNVTVKRPGKPDAQVQVDGNPNPPGEGAPPGGN